MRGKSGRRIDGEEELRQKNFEDNDTSDIMCASMVRKRPYGFIPPFTGGAHRSLMGQFSFFEIDQSHTGRVINHYWSTGANDHTLCVLAGKNTPTQKRLLEPKRCWIQNYTLIWWLGLSIFWDMKGFKTLHSQKSAPSKECYKIHTMKIIQMNHKMHV